MKPFIGKLLESAGADAFLETDPANITYLSGFSGTKAVLLAVKGSGKPLLITDSRYYGLLRKKKGGVTAVESNDFRETIRRLCEKRKIGRLAYNGDYLTVRALDSLKKHIRKARLVDRGNLIASFREVKNARELKKIKTACQIADDIYIKIKKKIKPGIKEGQIKNLIYNMSRTNAQGCAFDPIVASGANSAIPHYYGNTRKILSNDIILIDMGFVFGGYSSDLTRVIFTGKIKPIFKKIYNVVLTAAKLAAEKAAPGAKGSEVDNEARKFISSSGYGKCFLHSTGHGIGLNVHEKPYLSAKSGDTLADGNVFTVEPGIYIPERGGVRIENVFSLEKGTAVLLSKSETYNF
ncbi:MAG: Xaa-Pro peptidase family protein [bacterium]|nr:Xaa-Pro peptidase family protein [bacterium]